MNQKVLVVDDDTVSRLVLAHMVARLGHDVLQAEDMAGAEKLAAEARPDLVLADFCLPDGTAIDLLSNLYAAGITARFVVVTGVAEYVSMCSRPADNVPAVIQTLTKPVGSRVLARCLVDALDSPGRPA